MPIVSIVTLLWCREMVIDSRLYITAIYGNRVYADLIYISSANFIDHVPVVMYDIAHANLPNITRPSSTNWSARSAMPKVYIQGLLS